MLELGRPAYTQEFRSHKNEERRSHALMHEAFHVDAKAARLREEAGDTCTPEQQKQIEAQEKLAHTLYNKGYLAEQAFRANRTRGEKAKPVAINGIVAIVVAAEILSIPILLANIYMMCKKAPHHMGYA